jgi:protein-S-isoprenylcysteine O-methyltransferase Ste14
VLAWFAALIAGTANDMIFMALPLVDNFWQAQATIMITPRLPLYIPCVYVCFMYFPTVSVWRLGLPPLARAALTGLAAACSTRPTTSSAPSSRGGPGTTATRRSRNRLLGAPIGSTMWVITFTATFAWLLGRVRSTATRRSRARPSRKGLALASRAQHADLMVQMTALQQLDGGIPGPRAADGDRHLRRDRVAGLRRATPAAAAPAADRVLRGGGAVLRGAGADHGHVRPGTHRNASMHQTYGACHVEATDIAGLTRYSICAPRTSTRTSPSTASTGRLPAAGSEWYTVCGRPHTDFRAGWPAWAGSASRASCFMVGCSGGFVADATERAVEAPGGSRMKVFAPAAERSTGANLARTLGQTVLFWVVFIGVTPWLIVRIERELGVPGFTFTGQHLVALAIGLVGATFNLWSGVALAVVGRGTPFPTQTARELVVIGPYQYLRNPMAFGGLGVGFAVGVYIGSWGTLAYAVAGGAIWHAIARPMEERDLAERFGASYDHYRANVRCWSPRLSAYRRP